MRFRHPSAAKLQAWLDGVDGSDELDAHIDTCERCAGKIENFAAPEISLGSALSQAFAAPLDLVPRLNTSIDARLRNRADLALLAGMIGLPIETGKLLMDDDQD